MGRISGPRLSSREQAPEPRFLGTDSGKNDHYNYSDRRNKKSPPNPLSPWNAQWGTIRINLAGLYLHVGP